MSLVQRLTWRSSCSAKTKNWIGDNDSTTTRRATDAAALSQSAELLLHWKLWGIQGIDSTSSVHGAINRTARGVTSFFSMQASWCELLSSQQTHTTRNLLVVCRSPLWRSTRSLPPRSCDRLLPQQNAINVFHAASRHTQPWSTSFSSMQVQLAA